MYEVVFVAQVVGHKGKYTPADLSDDGEEKYEHSTVVGVKQGSIYPVSYTHLTLPTKA